MALFIPPSLLRPAPIIIKPVVMPSKPMAGQSNVNRSLLSTSDYHHHSFTHPGTFPSARHGLSEKADTIPMFLKDGRINQEWVDITLSQHPTKKERIPTIAIIDGFHQENIDINGDGNKDISHGELVEKVLTEHLKCKALRFENSKTFIFSDLVIEQAKNILEHHQKVEKIHAVNISLGTNMSLRMLSLHAKIPELTAENIIDHRESLRQAFLKSNHLNQGEVIRALESLTTVGIKVYVAGGNKGPESINVFGLARGVISVGNTNALGQVTHRSAKNSLLIYDQGIFPIKRCEGGFSLFGKDTPDLAMERFSSESPHHKTYQEGFIGQPASQVVTTEQEDYDHKAAWMKNPGRFKLDRSASYFKKLYSIHRLKIMGALEEETFNHLIKCGYLLTSFDDRHHFSIDQSTKKVIYDPAGTSSEGIINHFTGTSFASPMALARAIRAEFYQTSPQTSLG